MIYFRPDPADLARMKAPLGKLLAGQPRETIARLAKLAKEMNPPKTITVGDVVSQEALDAGVPVNLRIVDQRTMRRPLTSKPRPSDNTYKVRNPPGVITDESFETIKRAIKHDDALIVVDGEEDLLALPAVLEAPDRSFIVYGQPLEGIVVIVATESVRGDVRAIVGRMTREDVILK